MIAFVVAVVLAAGCALAAERLRVQRDKARDALTVAQYDEKRLHEDLDAARAERDVAIAERDAAFIERNVAITSVQWVPVPPDELARLAKTGCKGCFGAGKVETRTSVTVCICVQKKMSEDRKYGFSGGTPVRVATAAELAALGPRTEVA